MATNEAINKQLQEQKKDVKENTKERAGTIKTLLERDHIKSRFNEILKDRAPQYVSSIITLVNNDDLLKKADPYTIITSAMIAATLDLPIERNLGYAYIIPYRNRDKGIYEANFQMGYKGLIQLALRTSQYKAINVTEIYEGELIEFNRLTENLIIDQEKRISDKVIGYAAYFELLNGFRKYVYWTVEDINKHKERFSRNSNIWKNNFDAMAKKTVLKNMLQKWGILSIEMQTGLTREITEPQEHPERIEVNENNLIEG